MTEAGNIITAVVMAALGFTAGLPCCAVLNRIPAKWLCDYGEEPSEELLTGKRYYFKKHGLIVGLLLAAAFFASAYIEGMTGVLALASVEFVILALVAAADAKYTIIPDQFTIAAAVVAVGFAVTDIMNDQKFMHKWYEPLIGLAVGGGSLMLLDLFSMLVLKKEGFGFGDVKLLAALGVMFGWKYTIVLLVAASLIAAVHFLILIFSGKDLTKEGVYLPMGPYLCIGAAVTFSVRPWLTNLMSMYEAVMKMDTLP